jgi:hypothetical protein
LEEEEERRNTMKKKKRGVRSGHGSKIRPGPALTFFNWALAQFLWVFGSNSSKSDYPYPILTPDFYLIPISNHYN